MVSKSCCKDQNDLCCLTSCTSVPFPHKSVNNIRNHKLPKQVFSGITCDCLPLTLPEVMAMYIPGHVLTIKLCISGTPSQYTPLAITGMPENETHKGFWMNTILPPMQLNSNNEAGL